MTSEIPAEPHPRNRLRVLFSVGSLGGGGSERRLLDLLHHLDRQQFEPQVYLMEHRGELLSELPADVSVAYWHDANIRQSWGWRAIGKLAPATTRALHLALHLGQHPADLVVGWNLQSAYEAVWAARCRHVPLIACSLVEPTADLQTAFAGDPRAKQRATWTYQHAARVLANSHDLQHQIQQFYHLPAERVVAIPNLRDFERLDRLAAVPHTLPPATGPRLISVGRLHPQKGYPDLLRAMSLLPELGCPGCTLEIFGQGPQQAELEQLITDANLQHSVRLGGYVANPYPYVRSADLFVLASHYEGLPNVLLEALALGTPVVATDCPTGPREILDHGRWGRLTPVGDAESLANSIAASLHDLPGARQTARAASAAIRRQHDIQTGVRRFEALFVDVVRGTPQQRQ